MPHALPCFTAAAPLLASAASASALAALRQALAPAASVGSPYAHTLGEFIAPSLLAPAAEGKHSRTRLFSLRRTFWAFLGQVLERGTSCRHALAGLSAWLGQADPAAAQPAHGTAGYCRARHRLPQARLEAVGDHTAALLQDRVQAEERWRGHRVFAVDGTSTSMPDTAANQAVWPQPTAQAPGCGFPVAALAGFLSLGSGALAHLVAAAPGQSEVALARARWAQLAPGDVVVADRAFSSYTDLGTLQAQGAHAVMRLHAARRVDLAQGQPLGPGDWLVTLPKPRCRTPGCTPELYAALPATLPVRIVRYQVAVPGWRTKEVVLVTTLLDAAQYPAAALAELYHQRWLIEGCFRELKSWLGLDVLRCLSPAMVRKEVALHRIAYNLVRLLMQRAAHQHGVPLRRLSFKGALNRLQQWSPALAAPGHDPDRQALGWGQLLAAIARDLLPLRPPRHEPRAVKRRPKGYVFLSHPRHEIVIPPHHRHPRMKTQTGLK